MGCCNILTGYTPPRLPPSLNDYPLYIDRLHKEVWYWTGTSWELVWQVSIAGAGTAGVVKVSPSSPITIDAEGNLDIDCGRLKTKCNLATKADIDAAIATITTAINTILTRLGDLETKITNLTVTVTDLGRRITIVEGDVTDLSRRVTVVEGAVTNLTITVTDLGRRVTVVEGDVTDLSSRVTVVEGAVTNFNGVATDVTKLKADVARLDDPALTSRLSLLFRNMPERVITALAPHDDVTANVVNAALVTEPSYITLATYPMSVQKGAWKQLPNNRESITITLPNYAKDSPNWITPNWVPNVSTRGYIWPTHENFHVRRISNIHARLLRGSTADIDLPADYEQYLPDLCATASSAVVTLPNGTLGLSTSLDVTIVKHVNTPKAGIVVTIEFAPYVAHPSYLIPIPIVP